MSVDNRLYGLQEDWRVVEIDKKSAAKIHVSMILDSNIQDNFKDFDVTPGQIVVIATTNRGLMIPDVNFKTISDGFFHGVRVINEFYVYGIKEISSNFVVPFQVPIGKSKRIFKY